METFETMEPSSYDYLNHIKVANQNMPTSIYDCIIVIYQHFNASNATLGLQI
jgi:hypothetical protein